MHPLAILCVAAVLASIARADDACCIDADMATAFMANTQLSRDWPKRFPVRLNVPSAEFIGSSSSFGGRASSVAWRSDSKSSAVRQSVAEQLLSEDWEPMNLGGAQPSPRGQRGFIPHKPVYIFSDTSSFCLDGAGTLTLTSRDTDIGAIVTLSHSAQNRTLDCGAARVLRDRMIAHGGIIDRLPSLRLPETVESDRAVGSGVSGGGDSAASQLDVRTQLSTADLLAGFEAQMIKQGWQLETEYQSARLAGSVWLQTIDGLQLACTLSAVARSAKRMLLRMEVLVI